MSTLCSHLDQREGIDHSIIRMGPFGVRSVHDHVSSSARRELEGWLPHLDGVRPIYPMERQAMRFFNLLGNKSFAIAFSWLLGQPVRDTLCGTLVLWRSDDEKIAENRSYFGDFDPFGAARLNLRILEIPIRYVARTYGETNISRWRHGWLLLRMTLVAARKIKFGR